MRGSQVYSSQNNLQILCADCNHGKGNWDQTDWRGEPSVATVKSGPRLVKKRAVGESENDLSVADACRIWERSSR